MSTDSADDAPRAKPWWYHLGAGLLAAAITVPLLVGTGTWRSVVLFLVLVVGVLFDRLVSRLWPDAPYRGTRPRAFLFWLAVVIVWAAIGVGAWLLITTTGLSWLGWTAGLAVFFLITGSGYLWARLR